MIFPTLFLSYFSDVQNDMEVRGDFPSLFLSYFSDVLTIIMTSVGSIFLFISESLLVYVNYSCVIYML